MTRRQAAGLIVLFVAWVVSGVMLIQALPAGGEPVAPGGEMLLFLLTAFGLVWALYEVD